MSTNLALGVTGSRMGTSQSSRRRYIAREDLTESVNNEPATFHPPPTRKVFTSGSDTSVGLGSTPPISRAHTLTHHPDSTNGSMSRYSGTKTHDLMQGTGLVRSYTTDSAVGSAIPFAGSRTLGMDPTQMSSRWAHHDSEGSEASFKSTRSDTSSLHGPDSHRSHHGSRDSSGAFPVTYSAGSYPATYPGPRPQWEGDRLSEISKSSVSNEHYNTPTGRVLTGGGSVGSKRQLTFQAPSHDSMDPGAARWGKKQGPHSGFSQDRTGSIESAVSHTSKAHSLADLVICSPKQSRPFLGRKSKVEIPDFEEPSSKYNGVGAIVDTPRKVHQKGQVQTSAEIRREPGVFSPVARATAAVGMVANSPLAMATEVQKTRSGTVVPASELSATALTREERIAQYKDRRRKELASMFGSSEHSSFETPERDKIPSFPLYSSKVSQHEQSKEEKPETVSQISAFSPKPIAPLPGVRIEPKPIVPETQNVALAAPRLQPSGAMSNLLASSAPSAFTKVTPSSPKQDLPLAQVPQPTVTSPVAQTLSAPSHRTVMSPKEVLPPWKQPVTTTVSQQLTRPSGSIAVTSPSTAVMSTAQTITSSHTAVTSSELPVTSSSLHITSPIATSTVTSFTSQTSIPSTGAITTSDMTGSRQSRLVPQERLEDLSLFDSLYPGPTVEYKDTPQSILADFTRLSQSKSGSLPANFGLSKIPDTYKNEGTADVSAIKKYGDVEFRVTGEFSKQKKLTRVDSFNRPDSPIREPMPLPKESVIARNRRPRLGSSSSTDSAESPQRSPRVSPRVARKQKIKQGSSESSNLSVDYGPARKKEHRHSKEGSKTTNQLSSHHGENSASQCPRSPSQSTSQGQVKDTPGGLSLITQKREVISPPFSPTMGQQNSHSNLAKSPPAADQWATPPSTPKGDASKSRILSPTGVVSPTGRLGELRSSFDKQSSTETPQGSIPRPGSGSVMSDSSTTSSRRDRRRFRRRDQDGTPEQSPNIEPLKVRPGKKDKSSARKSSLNVAQDEEDDVNRRGQDSDDLRDTSSTLPWQLSHQTPGPGYVASHAASQSITAAPLSPTRTKQSTVNATLLKVQESPPPVEKFAHVRLAKPMPTDSKGVTPATLESKSAGTAPDSTSINTTAPLPGPVSIKTVQQAETPVTSTDLKVQASETEVSSTWDRTQPPMIDVVIPSTVPTSLKSPKQSSALSRALSPRSQVTGVKGKPVIPTGQMVKLAGEVTSVSASTQPVTKDTETKVVTSETKQAVKVQSGATPKDVTDGADLQTKTEIFLPVHQPSSISTVPESVQREAHAVSSAVTRLVATAIESKPSEIKLVTVTPPAAKSQLTAEEAVQILTKSPKLAHAKSEGAQAEVKSDAQTRTVSQQHKMDLSQSQAEVKQTPVATSTQQSVVIKSTPVEKTRVVLAVRPMRTGNVPAEQQENAGQPASTKQQSSIHTKEPQSKSNVISPEPDIMPVPISTSFAKQDVITLQPGTVPAVQAQQLQKTTEPQVTSAGQTQAAEITAQLQAKPLATKQSVKSVATPAQVKAATAKPQAVDTTLQPKAIHSQAKTSPIQPQTKTVAIQETKIQPIVEVMPLQPPIHVATVHPSAEVASTKVQDKVTTTTMQRVVPTVTQVKAASIQPQVKPAITQPQVKTATTPLQVEPAITQPQVKTATTPLPVKTATTPLQVKTASPQPQVKTATTQPQAKSDAASKHQLQVKTTTTQAQVRTVTQQPQVKTTTTQPQVKRTTTQPQVRTVTTQPQVKTATTQAQVRAVTTQPQVKTTTTQPQVRTITTQPQVKTATRQQQVRAVTTQTQVKTASAQPQVRTTTAQSQIKTATTQPQVKTVTTQPQVEPTMTQPHVKAATAQPQVKRTAAQPQVKPAMTQAQVKMVTMQPQVKTATAQSQVKPGQTQPQAKTTTEQSLVKTVTPQPLVSSSTTQPQVKTNIAPPQVRPSVTQPQVKTVTTQAQVKTSKAQPLNQTATTKPQVKTTTNVRTFITQPLKAATIQPQVKMTAAQSQAQTTQSQTHTTSVTQPQTATSQPQQVQVAGIPAAAQPPITAATQVKPSAAQPQVKVAIVQQPSGTKVQQGSKVLGSQAVTAPAVIQQRVVQTTPQQPNKTVAHGQQLQSTKVTTQQPAVTKATQVTTQQPAFSKATLHVASTMQPNVSSATPQVTTATYPAVTKATATAAQPAVSKMTTVTTTTQSTVTKATASVTAVQPTVKMAQQMGTPSKVRSEDQVTKRMTLSQPLVLPTQQQKVEQPMTKPLVSAVTTAMSAALTVQQAPQVPVSASTTSTANGDKAYTITKDAGRRINTVSRVESAISRLANTTPAGSLGKNGVTLNQQKVSEKDKEIQHLTPFPTESGSNQTVNSHEIYTTETSVSPKSETNSAPTEVNDKGQIQVTAVAMRRPPERTQSLRQVKQTDNEQNNLPKRTQSLRGGADVKRRFRSDKPDDELGKILNRRSKNLEEWEAQLAESDVTEAERAIEEYERQLEEEKMKRTSTEPVIVDSELSHVLKARRATLVEEDISTKLSVPKEEEESNKAVEEPVVKQDVIKTQPQIQSILKKMGSFEESQKQKYVIPAFRNGAVESELPSKPTSQTEGSSKTTLVNQSSGLSPLLKSNQQKMLVRTGSLDTPAPPSGQQVQRRPILEKAKTIEVSGVDSELAKVLRARRGSSDESQEETPDKDARQSPILEGEGGEEEGQRLSVMERISHMETRIVEEKFATSGLSTPHKSRLRPCHTTGPGSPKGGTVSPRLHGKVKSAEAPDILMSDSQLLAKLSDVALVQNAAAARRKRFQQRSRDDWRVRTQPVTETEISEADALDSVAAFRAEIMRHTGLNLFKQQSQQKSNIVRKVKGQEIFPQPFRRETLKERRRKPRYKTQPITLQELNEIPETEVLTALTPEFSESKQISKRKQIRKVVEQRRAAAWEDSDSDFEKLVEANYRQLAKPKKVEEMQELTMSMDVPEDDQSKMSIAQKMALFKKLEDEEKSKPPPTPKSGRKFGDRKKRLERSHTQPVTEEEVTQAAEFAVTSQGQSQQTGKMTGAWQPEVVNRAKSEEPEQESGSEDELSKLSMMEKMKLFSEKKEEQTPLRRETPVMRRKARRQQSRFKTQPITSDEVEKARISPLAMSLVKPPDPELLQTMSLKDQRDYMAQWAESTLTSMGSRPGSRPGSRAGSQPSSRRSSMEGEDDEKKGILKMKSVDCHELEVKGILKPERQTTPDREVRGILKYSPPELDSVSTFPDVEHRGILKHQGILKKESPPQDKQETRGILKKERSFETKAEPEYGVLKKDSSFEQRLSEPERGVLKREPSQESMEVRSILKEPSFEVEQSKTPELQGILKTVISSQQYESITKQKDSSAEEDISVDKISRIKNEAVAKRRLHREFRKSGERYHTQPVESVAKGEYSTPTDQRIPKPYNVGRHHTQPITDQEKENVEGISDPTSKMGGSITDRLVSLQENGESQWKKRIGKVDTTTVQTELGLVEVKLRERVCPKPERPSSIADRLSQLEGAREGWKQRIEEKDVTQFTVEGKLKAEGRTATPDSPLMQRKKRAFKPPLNRAKSSPVIPLPRDVAIEFGVSDTDSDSRVPSKIEVPKPDDETFSSFFQNRSMRELSQEKFVVSVDDFDHLFLESNDILQSARKAKPQRRKTVGSKNPLKTLAQRQDLQLEYTEIRTDVAQLEMKRLKREQIAGTAGFAQEALAGLASKENFSQVLLRKADSFSGSTPGGGPKFDPYKEVMLLHVKGRRHCQIRMVEPSANSINSGDCFVLVTAERVYMWVGEYSNVIEKAKAAEIATVIVQKHDLGCKSLSEAAIIEERKQDFLAGKSFWQILGGKQQYHEPGPQEEDELYEMYIVEATKVYHFQNDKLVILSELCGCVPKYDMLDSKEVFVFDFGSELYVWTGKQVPFDKRKIAIRLAKEIWDQGYDFSGNDINPLCPLIAEKNGGLPMKGSTRPEWALFAKVNQNMETILFREKFLDWPDSSRIIKVKGAETEGEIKTETADLQPYDAKKMVKIDTTPVSLVLEGSHVGRGDTWVEIYQDLRREYEILTLNIDVWHVLEYDHFKLDQSSHGQFHDGDTYVVRWHYMITQTGMKSLKGRRDARHSLTGRERCAYFFWQGRYSSVTEKGAVALMTVELDEERGPQVRVVQGKEPPCFVQLFHGRMIIYRGKREEEDTNTQGSWRCYIVRNERPNETYLLEIPCGTQNLRSRSSFLLLNINTGLLYVWHGAKSSKFTRQAGMDIALSIKEKCPPEIGLREKTTIVITAMEEGSERPDFWGPLGSKDRNLYHSLLRDLKPYTFSPRLFYMNSVSGVFVATEIQNPARHLHVNSPFPFLQSDLYKASQPAVFLVDNNHEVYLWQGWWPEGTEEEENVKTGSANARFNIDRRCALETTLSYCKEKNNGKSLPASVIYAGLEPKVFTNLFPEWEVDRAARDINIKEGKRAGEMVKVEDVLLRLTRTRYTKEELQADPLPDGVDPLKLESYLEDSEFEDMLGMPREEFYTLPAWRQVKLKKDTGLF